MMVTTATFLIFIIMTFGCLLGSLPCCLCCLRGCFLDIFWLLRVTIFNFFCIFVVICIFWVTTSTALAVWVGEALLTVPHPLFHVFLLRSWRRLRILLAHVALNLIILIGRKMVMDFGRTIWMIVIIVVVHFILVVVNWIATLCCCLLHLLFRLLCRSCCFPSSLGCFLADIACVSAMVTMIVRQ